MSREKCKVLGEAQNVLESVDEAYQTATDVGATAAVAIPATIRSGRKAITIQNQGTTNVFIAAPKPIDLLSDTYLWTKSASGTNEYYVTLADGTDPSLSQPDFIYTRARTSTAETSRTEAAAGSLAVNQWDYDDNDGLGFSTIYIRPGSDSDTPGEGYSKILYYDRAPANTGTNTGLLLGQNDSITINLTGEARVFAIAASGTPTVVTLEYV